MKNFLKMFLITIIFLPCLIIFSGCWGDKEKQPQEQPLNSVEIQLYSQEGISVGKSYNVDFTSIYYCEFVIMNANYYSYSGYFTQLNGQGIRVYDDYGYYTNDFISYCQNKSVVKVYEYKIDKTYSLTLVNGLTSTTQTHKVADSYKLPIVSKYGYTFEGWGESKDSSFTINNVYSGKYMENVTLYAIFKPISFYLYYSTNPYNPKYCNETKIIKFNEKVTITPPAEIGFIFHGFFTEPFGKGEQICSNDGEFIVDFLPSSSDCMYIYAYFTEAQTQKVIYDNNNIDTTMTVRYRGYYANDVEAEYVVTYNEGDIIECLQPQSRSGYYFDGWYTTQNSKYNFNRQTETNKLLILTAKFIKTDNILFSNIMTAGRKITMSNLAYNQPHIYTYVYDCEDGTVSFNGNFEIQSSTCTAMLNITIDGTLVYSDEIKSGETFSGSFSANRGQTIVFSSYVNQNASNGMIFLYFENNIDIISNSVRIVDRPNEFLLYVTEGSNFVIEYADIDGKAFVGYYTGENGTGVKLTDNEGNSLNPWEIQENNYYYKPHDDYITDEDDNGFKVYAYYIDI